MIEQIEPLKVGDKVTWTDSSLPYYLSIWGKGPFTVVALLSENRVFVRRPAVQWGTYRRRFWRATFGGWNNSRVCRITIDKTARIAYNELGGTNDDA